MTARSLRNFKVEEFPGGVAGIATAGSAVVGWGVAAVLFAKQKRSQQHSPSIDELEEQIQALKTQDLALRAKVTEMGDSLKQKQQVLTKQKATIADLDEALQSEKTHVAAKLQALSVAEAALADMKQQLETQQAQIDEGVARAERQDLALSASRDATQKLEGRCASLEESKKQLAVQLEETTSHMGASAAAVEASWREKLAVSRKELHQAQTERDALRARLKKSSAATEARHAKLEAEISSATGAINALKQQLSDQRTSADTGHAAWVSKYAAAQAQVLEAERQRDEAVRKAAATAKRMEAAAESHASANESAQDSLSQAKDANAALEAQVAELGALCEESKGREASLKEQVRALQSELASAQSDLEATRTTAHEGIQSASKETTKIIAAAEAKCKLLQKSHDDARRGEGAAKAEAEALRSELKEATTTNTAEQKELRAQIASIKGDLAAAVARATQAEAQMELNKSSTPSTPSTPLQPGGASKWAQNRKNTKMICAACGRPTVKADRKKCKSCGSTSFQPASRASTPQHSPNGEEASREAPPSPSMLKAAAEIAELKRSGEELLQRSESLAAENVEVRVKLAAKAQECKDALAHLAESQESLAAEREWRSMHECGVTPSATPVTTPRPN